MSAAPEIPVCAAATDDVAAPVVALYASLSFPPGGEPDLHRLRDLFAPGARLFLPPAHGPGRVLKVDEYVGEFRAFVEAHGLRSRGFLERELARRTERFGSVAHAFSVYESLFTAADAAPQGRGINSIQMVRDDGGWRIAALAWDYETPDNPLPARCFAPEWNELDRPHVQGG